MMHNLDAAITEYASAALLRYFRKSSTVSIDRTRFDKGRDLELLRHHWALSGPVRYLLSYLLEHRHETQALLSFQRRIDDAVVRGRIDARATLLHRARTGLATAVVSNEAVRSYDTGPNQVLAWVLYQAKVLSGRLSSWQEDGSGYEILAEDVIQKLDHVGRIEALREALGSPAVGRRPAPGTLRDAARSRRLLYRHAVAAHDLLKGVERGDSDAIEAVIKTTLVGPLEIWRRFELAVAMAIGEAISQTYKAPMKISILSGNSAEPVLSCGPFDVFWQQRTEHYKKAPYEPSEEKLAGIMKAYGLGSGGDRPDLIVVDREKGRVAAIVEVKFLAGDTANSRFREAADQIVRYGRGYADEDALTGLISRSLVVMSAGAPARIDLNATGVPSAADLASIKQESLSAWSAMLRL